MNKEIELSQTILSKMDFKLFAFILVLSLLLISICAYCILRKEKGKRKKPFKTLAFFTIVTLMDIPFLINEAYKFNDGYVTLWGASEVLVFYGTILGATATIIAVISTILYQKRQSILGTKPLLQTESNLLCFKEDIEKIPLIDRCFYYPFNKEERVGCLKDFSCTYIWQKDYPTFIEKSEYLVFAYTLSNAGLGNAISIDMKVNELICLPKFFLGNQQDKTFIFVIDKTKSNTKMVISFRYTDCFSGYTYLQEEQINIVLDEDGNLSYTQTLDDLISEVKILE